MNETGKLLLCGVLTEDDSSFIGLFALGCGHYMVEHSITQHHEDYGSAAEQFKTIRHLIDLAGIQMHTLTPDEMLEFQEGTP